MKRRTKIAISLAVPAAALAGGGIGYAASLGATAGTAGATVATVASCNAAAPQAIAVSWPTPTDSGTGWNVSSVNINGIDTDSSHCNGKTLYVDITNGSSVIATTTASALPPTGGCANSTTTTNCTVSASLSWVGANTIANATAVDVAIQ